MLRRAPLHLHHQGGGASGREDPLPQTESYRDQLPPVAPKDDRSLGTALRLEGEGGAVTESNAPTPTVRRSHSWYRSSEPEAWLGSRLLRPVPAIPALPAEIVGPHPRTPGRDRGAAAWPALTVSDPRGRECPADNADADHRGVSLRGDRQAVTPPRRGLCESFDAGRRLVAREHVRRCYGRVSDSQANPCRVPSSTVAWAYSASASAHCHEQRPEWEVTRRCRQAPHHAPSQAAG